MGIGRRSVYGVRARRVLLVPLALVGVAAWLMLPDPGDADGQAAITSSHASISSQNGVFPDEAAASTEQASAVTEDVAPEESPASAEAFTVEQSPIDGLQISRQFWRRGGLGSKALVTLTLRNRNHYPVKDIEIACTFARADGSHLTDRRRVITGTINTRSRKTYAGMLVGFVNVNADKAKCSVVTANRA